MSTLPLRADSASTSWTPMPQTSRVATYLSMLLDAYTEAMQQTKQTRRDYPFADV